VAATICTYTSLILCETIFPIDEETNVFTVFCTFAALCESCNDSDDDTSYIWYKLFPTLSTREEDILNKLCVKFKKLPSSKNILPSIEEESTATLCVKFKKFKSNNENLLSKLEEVVFIN
jgi:hypothetical protein